MRDVPGTVNGKLLRLGVICDFREEQWASMDLFGEMLFQYLHDRESDRVLPELILPKMVNRFGWWRADQGRFPTHADRFVNRFWDYPRLLRGRLGEIDTFHVCDHSYAHVIHHLPAGRAGVYCYDLDAFRPLLEPRSVKRSAGFRLWSWRVLEGFKKAAVVFYSTVHVREEIERYGLIDPARLVHAPPGTAPEFCPEPADQGHPPSGIPPIDGPYVLHVGTCYPRKRIDVLLDIFAEVCEAWPELRLVQVGGEWSEAHWRQMKRLSIESRVRQYRGLERSILAALYRDAKALLLTSEREGFGVPVIEALASGTIVIASDIPVLREVGGAAAVFCPVADVPAWAQTVKAILSNPLLAPSREARLARAQRFTWDAHGEKILEAYLSLGTRAGFRQD